jgi:hypothetical protein
VGIVDLKTATNKVLATEFVVHKNYKESVLANNIGLLKLQKPLEFNGTDSH